MWLLKVIREDEVSILSISKSSVLFFLSCFSGNTDVGTWLNFVDDLPYSLWQIRVETAGHLRCKEVVMCLNLDFIEHNSTRLDPTS
jgi:hypothetical protein